MQSRRPTWVAVAVCAWAAPARAGAPRPLRAVSDVAGVYAGPGARVRLVLPDRIDPAQAGPVVGVWSWLLLQSASPPEPVRASRHLEVAGGHGVVVALAEDLLAAGDPRGALGAAVGGGWSRLLDECTKLAPSQGLLALDGDATASSLVVTGRDAVGLARAAGALLAGGPALAAGPTVLVSDAPAAPARAAARVPPAVRFSDFPSAFLDGPALALPDAPTDAELGAAARIVAMLRRHGALARVPEARGARGVAVRAGGLIAIAGAAGRLDGFAPQVRPPLALIPPWELRDGGETVALRTTDGRAAAAQIAAGESAAVLALVATRDEELDRLVSALDPAAGLTPALAKANLLIVDGAQGTFAAEVGATAAAPPPGRLADLRRRAWLLPLPLALATVALAYLYRKSRGVRLA